MESTPFFVKFQKKWSEVPEWFTVSVPNGAMRVQTPQRHRLVLREALFRPQLKHTTTAKDGSVPAHTNDFVRQLVRVHLGDTALDTNQGYLSSAPWDVWYLECSDVKSLVLERAQGEHTKNEEHRMAFSHKVAPLRKSYDATNTEGVTTSYNGKTNADERAAASGWTASFDTPVFSIELTNDNVTQLQFRIADFEGHTLPQLRALVQAGMKTDVFIDNDTTITMAIPGNSGTQTIAASAAYFGDEHIGRKLKFHSGVAEITSITSTTAAVADVTTNFTSPDATADWSISKVGEAAHATEDVADDMRIDLELAFTYEKYMVETETPKHPQGDFMGYFRNAINQQDL